MILAEELARQIREVHFGGNWTSVNLRDTLADVSWSEAVATISQLNTLARLVYHCNYYVQAVTKVLEGEALLAKDQFSFDAPLIQSEKEWAALTEKTWKDARHFDQLVSSLSDVRLGEIFVQEKYGSYYRNISGIIEHLHYHLGQIVLIKKMLRQPV